jgi:hypothetical protein
VGLPLAHRSGSTIALGISGTHEKGEHLLDSREPSDTLVARTAPRPARGRARSVLVAAPSAADADALSTAMYVAGYEPAARFMSELPYAPAMAQIDSRGVPRWNGIFRQHWGDLATGSLDRPPARSHQATMALGALAVGAILSQPAFADGSPGADTATGATANTATDAASAPDVGSEEGTLDLGAMSANTFAPYVTERHPGWIALPLFALSVVLIHLKKVRRTSVKAPKRITASFLLASVSLWATLEQAHAVDLVPMGQALIKLLGTPKAMTKKVDGATAVYAKDGKGKVVAFIEKNVWNAQCDHTWLVGIGKDGKVTQVVAQNQQCPHAKPSAAESFLDQYKGKGPADVAKLKSDATTIAKATGSCELASDAVVHAVNSYQKIKGQF